MLLGPAISADPMADRKMVMPENPPVRHFRPVSVRSRVNQQFLRFAVLMGAFGLILAALCYSAILYLAVQDRKGANLRTLSEINCNEQGCDTTVFNTDWQIESPDYVVDTKGRYLLDMPGCSEEEAPRHFRPLDLSDLAFVERFREPATYATPDRESWQLFSQPASPASLNNKPVDIIVGYAMVVPWKMIETPDSLIPVVDRRLKIEADEIAKDPSVAISSGKLTSDGLEVVDRGTGEVVLQRGCLPSFLPATAHLPGSGTRVYRDGNDLSIVRTDVKGPLVVVSPIPIGNVWLLLALAVLVFVLITATARWLSRRYLRNYFTLSNLQVPSIEEALRQGEGQCIEFKRALAANEARDTADMEVLKSIAAFANTNDGAIFIGVDDRGIVKGLQFDHKQRDSFALRIAALARHHVRPTPPIRITFEKVDSLIVSRVAVPRGTAIAYLLGGVIYVRYGSSDVPAQPEDLARLLA